MEGLMSENGQIKCEKCGSTDISQNPKTGKLIPGTADH